MYASVITLRVRGSIDLGPMDLCGDTGDSTRLLLTTKGVQK